MKQKIYIVDAFANQLFQGNQAAVLVMENWPSDLWMQKIAMENQFSETAFLVRERSGFRIRWFTPTVEVDLCGHATLAACYILWMEKYTDDETILLDSNSGKLSITKFDPFITLDFPVYKSKKNSNVDQTLMKNLFGYVPVESWTGMDQILFFETKEIIEKITPNFDLLKEQITERGWIIIAPYNDKKQDYCFRFFAPKLGINEDSATGSAQCSISYFWFSKFQRSSTSSHQLSKRGAYFKTELNGDRVKISGKAQLYLIGEIDKE